MKPDWDLECKMEFLFGFVAMAIVIAVFSCIGWLIVGCRIF